jgi:ribosomal protein L40E
MAKKKLGYIELHWECPNCGTINIGSEKVCKGCAAPQPEGVEFFQASQQQLIEDEERLKKAKAGADIHCAYCGTRNPPGAETCSQCKADLSEGTQRKAGRVVGAFRRGEVKQIACPHCGTQNPETAGRCGQCGGRLTQRIEEKREGEPKVKPVTKPKRGVMAIIGLLLLGVCLSIYFVFFRTSALSGEVTGVQWERSMVLEQIIPVEYQDWVDQIPSEGEIVSCTQEQRGETDQPTEGAQEICGTPYSVDTGGGYAEVVQDCTYIIYDDYCTYTLMEWGAVDMLTSYGQDFDAFWPEMNLADDQRLQYGEESYTIIFFADGDTYSFTTSDYELFQQVEIGSRWDLEVNAIGGVQSINP